MSCLFVESSFEAFIVELVAVGEASCEMLLWSIDFVELGMPVMNTFRCSTSADPSSPFAVNEMLNADMSKVVGTTPYRDKFALVKTNHGSAGPRSTSKSLTLLSISALARL